MPMLQLLPLTWAIWCICGLNGGIGGQITDHKDLQNSKSNKVHSKHEVHEAIFLNSQAAVDTQGYGNLWIWQEHDEWSKQMLTVTDTGKVTHPNKEHD